MTRLAGLLVLLALLGAACTSGEAPAPPPPEGPATIRPEVVRRHAREFSTDLADREPGTQEEQAAAAYMLGHLQQAGYLVQLDGVPVGNLVRSTNLVARPPSGEDPDVVVAVAYGTGPDGGGGGLTLGLFLELARALRAAEPEHSVEFVALGAERPGFRRGDAGSRALANTLRDADLDPLVITFAVTARDQPFYVDPFRSRGDELIELATGRGLRPALVRGPAQAHVTVLNQAGLDHLRILGPQRGTGEVLLDYLSNYSR